MTTITADATEVVGRALYLEAERTSGTTHYVTQILITPEVVLSTEVTANMAMYRRRISTVEPRKTWRHYSSPTNAKRAHEGRALALPDLLVAAVSDDMLNFVRSTLTTLIEPGNGYRLVKQPIVVEVTRADITDVRLGKTPYKIFGRVWKSRKKLGFPESFLPS